MELNEYIKNDCKKMSLPVSRAFFVYVTEFFNNKNRMFHNIVIIYRWFVKNYLIFL